MMDKFKLIFGLKTATQVQLSESTIKSRCVKLKPFRDIVIIFEVPVKLPMIKNLVHFKVDINIPYKLKRGKESYSAQHEEKHVTC